MEKISIDIAKALKVSATKKLWENLTPLAQKDFITWIETAKQSKTRAYRIERMTEMLKEGKKRPCCYAVVPLGIYTRINTSSKTKAQWKTLNPTQKRDFVEWVESPTNPSVRTKRLEEIPTRLLKIHSKS